MSIAKQDNDLKKADEAELVLKVLRQLLEQFKAGLDKLCKTPKYKTLWSTAKPATWKDRRKLIYPWWPEMSKSPHQTTSRTITSTRHLTSRTNS